jgi:hypothetical protein
LSFRLSLPPTSHELGRGNDNASTALLGWKVTQIARYEELRRSSEGDGEECFIITIR